MRGVVPNNRVNGLWQDAPWRHSAILVFPKTRSGRLNLPQKCVGSFKQRFDPDGRQCLAFGIFDLPGGSEGARIVEPSLGVGGPVFDGAQKPRKCEVRGLLPEVLKAGRKGDVAVPVPIAYGGIQQLQAFAQSP